MTVKQVAHSFGLFWKLLVVVSTKSKRACVYKLILLDRLVMRQQADLASLCLQSYS